MKVQLDENTFNAYLNEAIRQEISESLIHTKTTDKINEGFLKGSELRIMVKFNSLGRAAAPVQNGLKRLGDLIKKGIQKGAEMLGMNSEGLQNRLYSAKNELEKGTYGAEDSSFIDIDWGWSNPIPKVRRIGYGGQDRRTFNGLFSTLKGLGYSNQQIHEAIEASWNSGNHGPIMVGTNPTGQQFLRYTGKKAQNKLRALMAAIPDEINHPENYEDETQNDLGNKVQRGIDKTIEKGKELWDKAKEDVQNTTPEEYWNKTKKEAGKALNGAKERLKRWGDRVIGDENMPIDDTSYARPNVPQQQPTATNMQSQLNTRQVAQMRMNQPAQPTVTQPTNSQIGVPQVQNQNTPKQPLQQPRQEA